MDPLGRTVIDTDDASAKMRERIVDKNGNILISSLDGSEQAADITEPANCGGLGRIRHFRRQTSMTWPDNPLPIDPAIRALGLPEADAIRSQLYQVAACNWRCWYCYVPFSRLSGDQRTSRWVSPDALVEAYANVPDRPPVLVLSGGQPDLAPEWLPATIRALRSQGLSETCYVWVDDNLSTDYFWRYLDKSDISHLSKHRLLGRVGCFKGFDERSFVHNTRARPSLFYRQFDLMKRYIDSGIDMYAYATFTAETNEGVAEGVHEFVDALQTISRWLPLRVVPLEVKRFTPGEHRITSHPFRISDDAQQVAIQAWNTEMEERFSADERSVSIADVVL